MARMPQLQFWKVSHAGSARSASISTLVHVLVIALSIEATMPSPEVEGESDRRIRYFPPPDPKPAGRTESRETLRFVQLAPEGPGAGFGGAGLQPQRAPEISQGPEAGNTGRDTITAPDEQGSEGPDSVFTIIEVDSAAARIPESLAPQYPQALLERHVEGQAIVQFVVDTTGFADVSSFRVVLASHIEFAESVREALPGMRFSAARIGSVKVRQLVELPFHFRVAMQIEPVAVKARPPR
ncbi:MAG: TonB family protein [Gemmatimonadaceae bacterium]